MGIPTLHKHKFTVVVFMFLQFRLHTNCNENGTTIYETMIGVLKVEDENEHVLLFNAIKNKVAKIIYI